MTAADALAAVLTGRQAPLGAVVGIAGPDGRALACGGLTRPGGDLVTERTRFDLASVTKVVTTCALHRLAVLGQLAFTDPIQRYLPATACAAGTTVADLARHRAGLWEWQPLYLTGGDPWAALDALPLRYPPLQERHYSDLGFMLLGRLIETVAGASLAEAIAQLVAEPLGLTRLGFGPVTGDVAAGGFGDLVEREMARTGEPYPVLFSADGFGWRDQVSVGEANDGNAFHGFGGVSGHAGLFGDAAGLLTLAASLADPDTDQLWGTDVRAQVFADGPDAGQALGWRSQQLSLAGRSVRMLWHPGFTGCAVGFVPEQRLAMVMLTNRLFAAERPDVATLWAKVAATIEPGLSAGEDANDGC
jgi:Beta-lactamase class C and other penicillin binding proteins